jgi:hypothetical protein
MAKCSKCQKRKAKRTCLALGESLCSLCCGKLREKEISCPPQCRFLKTHSDYQEKRILERKETPPPSLSPEEDILKDERMAWLAFHIEKPLQEYGKRDRSFTDKDALLALEYAKEKVQRGRQHLILPEQNVRAGNEPGDAIVKLIEMCKYEKKIILPGEHQTYSDEEKIKCIDRIILALKSFAQNNFEGRKFIEVLTARAEKIDELSHQSKVITIK